MAYVIWRVMMKKYSRIRLGLTGSMVTPTGHHALTYDEESWKQSLDESTSSTLSLKEGDSISRSSDSRKSKTKRVKSYLKKCKNALGRSSSSESVTQSDQASNSSWYFEEILKKSEVKELEDVYEDAEFNLRLDEDSCSYQVASIVHVRGDVKHDDKKTSEESSPPLSVEQRMEDGVEVIVNEKPKENLGGKNDVSSLVDKYFGPIYDNYELSRKCLIRQARNLLVCEYRGCFQRFENEFCFKAAKLLHFIKGDSHVSTSTPLGWPLSLGPSGIAIHLGPLDPSVLRNRDCYLCIRPRSAPGLELSLTWRQDLQIRCHTIAEYSHTGCTMCSPLRSPGDLELASYDDYDGAEQLPQLLQHLLVSVEHVIERVPLDDLAFPCPQCQQYLPVIEDGEGGCSNACACQCSCQLEQTSSSDLVTLGTPSVTKKDSSMQTSPMFEFVGSIPHIDSDEDDDKESIKSGISNRNKLEVALPKRITDLPDKLLMSGINLPGTADNDGRPIILCYAECVTRAGLNKYEIAKLLLFYASIPTLDCTKNGFSVLLLAESEPNDKVLEILDKTACLISNSIKIARYLVWRPRTDGKKSHVLPSRIQVIVVSNESTLHQYINKKEAPASCGGLCNHDQLEWVEFFKQVEPFLQSCKTAGKCLITALSQLRTEDVPQQITRKFLNHQCRQIARVLDLEQVQKLRRDGDKTLSNLKERSQWLSSSKDVARKVSFALNSFEAVEKVVKRLEQLKSERADRLKELARFNSLNEEAEELLTWINKVGEVTLGSLTVVLRSVGDAAGVKQVANDFEKFFFIAWRQIEKSNDLFEECKHISDPRDSKLKDSSAKLHTQMKLFREQLEETRERLEDCSRCFLLLDSCHDILEDDCKELEEFVNLAERSRNEKLLQICKKVKETEDRPPPDKCPPTATSTPIKGQNTQIRRRSVSSLAFIYHCSHHAAGESCSCYESDTENTVSYKLKKKYIQTLQNCVCNTKDSLERKNSATLDGIKEERESVENLLEKMDSDHRCDSGLSTADNSVGEEPIYGTNSNSNTINSSVTKKKLLLQRACSCQYYRETCTLCSNSSGSNQDHTEHHQHDSIIEEGSNDGFGFDKNRDAIEECEDDEDFEGIERTRRKVPPISANSHLYCHASNLDLPIDALYSNMDPKTQKTLKYIIREMIETERDYVKSLDYVIVNYIPELMREDIPQALRGQRNIVFGNVEKIYEFHSQHFLGDLEECESNPLQVGQMFLKHDKKFYLYALYNKNKPKSDSLMSEYGSSFFKSKQLELNDKMDLASYLLKPVQRMGKYALLIQQMMKACPDAQIERIQELEDLKQAEEMVRFKLRHGNDLLAMDSIRECDVNLKEQGSLLRQNEFLVWEGRSGKKSLRQVFLFEELILFSKARRFPDRKNLDLYIYKNSIKMTDIGLTARIGESPTKFAIWFRKRKPNDTFTLQSMSEDVKKAWTEELSQLLWKQAIKNRAVRMAEMSSMGIGNKPCLDIRPSADQISDRSISVDQLSKTPRFRNSIVGSVPEPCRKSKRPHSVISVSSVSSGSTSSGGSSSGTSGGGNNTCDGSQKSSPGNNLTLINLTAFESSVSSENKNYHHRSATLNSQCSTESGIIADMSMGSDEYSENHQPHTEL